MKLNIIKVTAIFVFFLTFINSINAALLYEESGSNPINWTYWSAFNGTGSCGNVGGVLGCTSGTGWGAATLRGQQYTVASYDNVTMRFNATVSRDSLNQGMMGWGASTGQSYTTANDAHWYFSNTNEVGAVENNGTNFYTAVTGLTTGTIYSFKITMNTSNTLYYYKVNSSSAWTLDRETTFTTTNVWPLALHKRGDVTFRDFQVCSNDDCEAATPPAAVGNISTNLSTYYNTTSFGLQVNNSVNSNLSYILNPTYSPEFTYFPFDFDYNDYYGVNNGTNSGTTFQDGYMGYAANFTGSEYIDLNTDIIQVNNTFAVSLWFHATADGAHRTFVGDGQTSSGDWLIYKNTDDKVGIFSRDNAGNFGNILVTNWTADQWNHLVVTRVNSSLLQLYVNNVFVGSSTTNFGAISNPHDTTIGASNDGTARFMVGKLDEIRFFDTSLNSSQVSDLYNKNVTEICNNCTNGNTTISGVSEGLNNITFYGKSASLAALLDSFTVDLTVPSLNVTNNSEWNDYTVDFSRIINVTSGDSCAVTLVNGTSFDCSLTRYNFSTNGNHTFNVSGEDLSGNINDSLNNVLTINPTQYFRFYDTVRSIYVQNYTFGSYNATGEYVEIPLYDLGFGTHDLLFSLYGYNNESFNFTFNSTSNLNQSFNVTPVTLTIQAFDSSDTDLQVIVNITISNATTNQTFLNQGNFSANFTDIPNGNITIDLSSANYADTSYITVLNPFTSVSITAYMTQTNFTSLYIFTVTDKSTGSALSGVEIEVQRLINSSYVTLGQKTTTGTGQTYFYLDSSYEYKVIFTKGGYVTATAQTIPTVTTYNVKLVESSSTYSYVEGVSYAFTPSFASLYSGNSYNFTGFISGDGFTTTYYSLTLGNGTIIYSTTSSNPSGTTFNFSNYFVNNTLNTTTITANLTYLKDGDFSSIYKTYTVYTLDNNTILQQGQVLGDDDSENSKIFRWLVIMTVITAILVAGTAVGIKTLNLMVIPAMVFFTFIGWIPWTIAAVASFISLVFYIGGSR